MTYVFLEKSKGNAWLGTVKKFADGKFYVKVRRGQSGWKFVGHAKTHGIKAPKGRRLHMSDPFQKQKDKREGKKREEQKQKEFRIKALMAGSGVNAANFTGGRALSVESLEGGKPRRKKREDR